MTLKDKVEKIEALDEKSLREAVLVPLLSRMGLRAATIYHGPRERGKDIVAIDLDRLGNREYIAVVAKTRDLDGSVSSASGLREVLYQVEQCFDVPYEDLFGMRSVTMNRVWVVTSGRIKPGASDSIFETLQKQNLSKLVRFIDREGLIDTIDQYYGEYWSEEAETVDGLREQKQKLLSFARELLLQLGAKDTAIEEALNAVLYSYTPPVIAVPPDRTLTRLSSYRIEMDTIAEKYSHALYSYNCGLIRDAFFDTKQELYYAMFRVDEIMEQYEKVITIDDPQRLLDEFDAKLSDDFPFWRASAGRADDALQKLGYLRDGLQDIDELCEGLRAKGKLDWALALLDSVQKLDPEIHEFLSHADQEQFSLTYRVETSDSGPALRLVHGSGDADTSAVFRTTHKRTIETDFLRPSSTRTITAADVTREIYKTVRAHLDSLIEARED